MASGCRIETVYNKFNAVTPEYNRGGGFKECVSNSVFHVSNLALRLVLVLLVGCRLILMCLILAGSISPLLANLTLGIICKHNVRHSGLSNKLLVSAVVIFFSLEVFDPEKLCPQMDK